MKQSICYDFSSMDTLVEVQALGEELNEQFVAALKRLPNWFDQVEEAVSRFNPASELSKLNGSNGGTINVSHLLLTLIEQALAAAKNTGGIFDPTVLNSLVQSGYDKSFGELAAAEDQSDLRKNITHTTRPDKKLLHLDYYREIKIDLRRSAVTLPPGLGIDLGGIAKGWAVDQAMEYVQKWESDAEVCINAGGDLRLHVPAGGEPWKVAVQNPFDQDQDLGFIILTSAAVATSSVLKRRWQTKGRVQHHIIDPRLSEPSHSDMVAATVVAPTAAEAEVWTKTLCILGKEEGFALLARQAGRAALGFLNDGSLVVNKQMKELIIFQPFRILEYTTI
ncbi:MAG: FAD:protein FMN transferase [Desulfosporosinus sp.]|nr:FAD:protein FMN transferase [Desulfosporosinus sp.]